MLQVNEVFYSLQGEGKYLGVPSLFIRFNLCNLRCMWKNRDGSTTSCDTPYTSWNAEKCKRYKVDELFAEICNLHKEHKFKHVVITGGEPFIQQDLKILISSLNNMELKVTVETNGTIFKQTLADLISLSPKMKNSVPSLDYSEERSIHLQGLQRYTNLNTIKKFIDFYDQKLVFKFVYSNAEDIHDIKDFITKYKIDSNKVWLMPQGITKQQLEQNQKDLFEICMKEGYNYTPRLHIDVFGDKRGI